MWLSANWKTESLVAVAVHSAESRRDCRPDGNTDGGTEDGQEKKGCSSEALRKKSYEKIFQMYLCQVWKRADAVSPSASRRTACMPGLLQK
jgi:hypothetical protein